MSKLKKNAKINTIDRIGIPVSLVIYIFFFNTYERFVTVIIEIYGNPI